VLSGAEHRGYRGRGGEDSDDHCAVRRGKALDAERAEQRPAKHDAGCHDREAPKLPQCGHLRAGRHQDQSGQDRRECLAADANEHRVELLDRHTRGRQREAEGENAEEAEEDRHAA
jgi:hypothetical protein